LEDVLRGGQTTTPPGDVLCYLFIGVIVRALKPSGKGLTVVGIVGVIALIDHLLRMGPGCLGEYLADA
jgi:hypothetical protein